MTVSALLLASLVAMLMWANSWAHGDRLAERSNRALRLLTGSSQPTCIRLADDAGDILYRCGNYRCSVQEDAVNWGNGPVIEGADYYTCTRSDREPRGPWRRCAVNDRGRMAILSRTECELKAWRVPNFDPIPLLL